MRALGTVNRNRFPSKARPSVPLEFPALPAALLEPPLSRHQPIVPHFDAQGAEAQKQGLHGSSFDMNSVRARMDAEG